MPGGTAFPACVASSCIEKLHLLCGTSQSPPPPPTNYFVTHMGSGGFGDHVVLCRKWAVLIVKWHVRRVRVLSSALYWYSSYRHRCLQRCETSSVPVGVSRSTSASARTCLGTCGPWRKPKPIRGPRQRCEGGHSRSASVDVATLLVEGVAACCGLVHGSRQIRCAVAVAANFCDAS